MQVTIDRFSNNNNPVAETDSGHVLVFGAKEVGESLNVRIEKIRNASVGIIIEPTDEQKDRVRKQTPLQYRKGHELINHHNDEGYNYHSNTRSSGDSTPENSPSWNKEISDSERNDAHDNSKRLSEVADEYGGTVTESKEQEYPRYTTAEERDSKLASDVSQSHN